MLVRLAVLLFLVGAVSGCFQVKKGDDSNGDKSADPDSTGDGGDGGDNGGDDGGDGNGDGGGGDDGSFTCPADLKASKGNTCCNDDLKELMEKAMEVGDDYQKIVNEMRDNAEAKFTGNWECMVGACNFGYAIFREGEAHCKAEAFDKHAVCFRNRS